MGLGGAVLHSMTGYGRGEAHNGELTVVVELRSKNNRFRDLHLRCPREYATLEARMSTVLKASFARGRIDATVHRTSQSAAQVVVDAPLARRYAEALEELSTVVSGGAPTSVSVAFLAEQPGVLVVQDGAVDAESEWDLVQRALHDASAGLLEMRATEGAALSTQLSDCLTALEAHIETVREATDGIATRVKDRLHARLAALAVDHDPQRIAQEVALLADKADITEELVRLHSHVAQFREAITTTESVGRRLEFLLQEMNREVNTIGSKASEYAISQRVVDMKAELERMREQAANVQ